MTDTGPYTPNPYEDDKNYTDPIFTCEECGFTSSYEHEFEYDHTNSEYICTTCYSEPMELDPFDRGTTKC